MRRKRVKSIIPVPFSDTERGKRISIVVSVVFEAERRRSQPESDNISMSAKSMQKPLLEHDEGDKFQGLDIEGEKPHPKRSQSGRTNGYE